MIALQKNTILSDVRIKPKSILVQVGKTKEITNVGNATSFFKGFAGELIGLGYIVALGGGIYLLYTAGSLIGGPLIGIPFAAAGLIGVAFLFAG